MANFISIEGNIGSGKSTFMEKLKKYYSTSDYVVFLDEPVSCWVDIKDSKENIIEKFYRDTKKYAFSFQMMAYISRLSIMKESIKKNPNKVFITERSVLTDYNVFAKMLYDDGMIEEVEYQIYMKWFNHFYDELVKTMKIVYVDVKPEKCLERIQNRGRKGENISIDYLENCESYHLKWFSNMNITKLDGNENIKDIKYFNWILKVNSLITDLCFHQYEMFSD